jgi:Tfp pilus assembly protein PilF
MKNRSFAWLFIVVATVAQAQESGVPRRPKLGAGADTNDAKAYFAWGSAQLERAPAEAADAFYWAARIEPSWADAYYARWAAMLLSDPHRLERYMKGDQATRRTPTMRQIDSLFLRAMTLDPFLYLRYQGVLYSHAQGLGGTTTTRERLPVGTTVDSSIVPNPSGLFMGVTTPGTYSSPGFTSPFGKAWTAYAAGNLPRALQEWAALLSAKRERSLIYGERGRVFWIVGAYDSAAVQFAQAAAEWRPEDKDRVPAVGDSKTLYEYSLGLVEEKLSRPDSARAIYRRLLEGDPSFAAAHLRLSALALAAGDTVASLGELDIATQVQATDPVIAYQYGSALVRAGHDAEALEQLTRATGLDPYYAPPRMLMALVYDAAGMTTEALAQYRAYLNIASENSPAVPRAKARVAAMAAPPPPPAKP